MPYLIIVSNQVQFGSKHVSIEVTLKIILDSLYSYIDNDFEKTHGNYHSIFKEGLNNGNTKETNRKRLGSCFLAGNALRGIDNI